MTNLLREKTRPALAAAILTSCLIRETISEIENDDDRFAAGMFVFVFSNYFASLIGGSFEIASSLALMRVVGVDQFERCIASIPDEYNRMTAPNSTALQAMGKTCEAWFKNPGPAEFDRLKRLFTMVHQSVKSKKD